MARSLSALLLLLVAAVAASAQYQDDSVGTAFFLDKDLYPGSKMTLHFTLAAAGAALPRALADTIPFASARIQEILSRLPVPAGSPAAAAVRSTLAACEAAPVPGVEALRCVTSPDSMADLAASILGTRNIRAAATKLTSTEGATTRQEYTMVSVRPLPVAGGDMVACHRMPYPYAVFACHATTAAVYAVSLAGADGTTAKGEALAACHADAFPGISQSAYEKLGVEPGSVPVCHFLPQDSMLWMRN
ncbi:hypothetical protein SEVIR_8G166800v4 [Setaria viridis]|uniref:BURP domain-containing protein n=1 Tax=Setaria viridis TaxID=4556 RepID=A0A4U6THV5_SETVI|nr:BURP domain-containing protein 6-like [Setaria viridis]TKW01232.1 hypothetical protein SEVIR_8G166800v2 [Setaria viridis]